MSSRCDTDNYGAFAPDADPGCDRALRSCVSKLSLEQLGTFADRIISEMEQKGELKKPQQVLIVIGSRERNKF